jgi:hypothetical protein
MPTISQLRPASQVTAADEVPVSQSGATMSVSVGALLASTQPAIMAPTGSLLGRVSLGAGGPEPIAVGSGLQIASETLIATGADHAEFAAESVLTPTDQAVVNSAGTPKLVELALLRGLFSPGQNISIDSSGTISAAVAQGASGGTASYSITALPPVLTIGSTDLVGISQGGKDHTIAYANLINGQTIDQAQQAGAAADSDTLWVGQGGSTTLRQSLSAIWTWIAAKLSTYSPPVLEITANTTLSPTQHGSHLLICSQPVTISPPAAGAGPGFQCEVINLSSGNVTFATGIITSSGTAALPAGQAAGLYSATYSGGTVTYASLAGAATSAQVPGQVAGLAISAIGANSVTLIWTALSPAASSYNVQYRVTGTSPWSSLSSSTVGCVVSSLLSGTSYDFTVAGVNSVGTGSPSAIVSASTASGLSAPGQVVALSGSNPTSSSISLTWSAPISGGTPGSYTVQYRITGNTTWNTGASGVATTSYLLSGLSAATSYDVQVFATNGAGNGSPSAVFTSSTLAGTGSVTSVTWNLVPSGSYVHAAGAIGVNAQITPATAPVQFGFSTSATTPPTSWTVATYVNTNLWGAYVPTPASPGTWYAWVEGTDGSFPTAYATPFTVT